MTIAPGTETYMASASPVAAIAVCLSESDLSEALATRVASLLRDDSGTLGLRSMMEQLAATSFQRNVLEAVLSAPEDVESWRVGEALAEAYLTDHRDCEFPWPSSRDQKNRSASLPGTDLLGFQQRAGGLRFAFAEVKTSAEEKWPPTLVTGRHGLREQLSALRDSVPVKCQLVRYLGYRAVRADWRDRFTAAASRFFSDHGDVSLFGLLVRDVEPRRNDLHRRAQALAVACPAQTSIELIAVYLPRDAISKLPKLATDAMAGAS